MSSGKREGEVPQWIDMEQVDYRGGGIMGQRLRRSELARTAPLKRGSGPKRGRGFAASREQRAKVKGASCIVTGPFVTGVVDPAHLASRAQGGCDDPLCVVPLSRYLHRQFDEGMLDLLPYLVPAYTAEIAHAVGHYNGDLIALLHRLTGCRWVPESER